MAVLSEDEVKEARRLLSYFTAKEPLIVPPRLYRELVEEPGIADMMDRVRPQQLMPVR